MHTHDLEKSKYDTALERYDTNLDKAQVSREVHQLLEQHLAENDTKEVRKFLLHCVDLTSLHTDDTEESILKLTESVNKFVDEYGDLENVAAICVYPALVKIVSDSLEADGVEIAAVSGGFPHAQTLPEVKMAETALCRKDGATEIDIVMNIGKFLSGDYEAICDEMEEQKALCGEEGRLKVILETGLLKEPSLIKKAAILALYSGADFLKTSTGKLPEAGGATPEAALIMCQTLREYYEKTGRKAGFKAAGGINSVRDALQYYTIVKEVLGAEWLSNQYFRIGTSRLANTLLSEITDEEVHLF
ncbi:MAG: deoxyribose-phosphate aldolase [Bacteroidaceae bacterium]|jgi:deoxyribose-phosphate aldolase